MKSKLNVTLGVAGALAFALSSGWVRPAAADVMATWTATPNFIAAGQSTTLDLTLTLSPDPGFDPTLAPFGFQNVGVTISPLNGSPNASPPGVFGFSASGLPQVDFQLPVTYGTPGTYFPTFAADVSYAETHLVFEQISSIGCGFF